MSVPLKRNAAGQTRFIFLFDGTDIKTTPTIAAGDFQVSIDGGAFNNLATLPSESPAASGQVKIEFSQPETNSATTTAVKWKDQAGGNWSDGAATWETEAITIGEIAAQVWEILTATLATVGSIGKLLVDNIDAAISTRSTFDETTDTVVNVTNVAALSAGAIAAASYAAGAINAAAIAANAIGASELATDAIGADQLAASAVDEIVDQVWDELVALHLGAGSTGAALNAAGGAADPWGTALPGAYIAGSAGNILGNNLDAAITTVLARLGVTGGGVNTVLGILQAMSEKAATLPTDIGGTFTPATDSLEAIRDALRRSDVAASVDDNELTAIRRGDLYENEDEITGLGDISGRTKLWITAKNSMAQEDADAVFQIVEGVGLEILNGVAGGAVLPAWASITVVNPGGDAGVNWTLTEEATVQLGTTALEIDVQYLDADGTTTPWIGKVRAAADVTRGIT